MRLNRSVTAQLPLNQHPLHPSASAYVGSCLNDMHSCGDYASDISAHLRLIEVSLPGEYSFWPIWLCLFNWIIILRFWCFFIGVAEAETSAELHEDSSEGNLYIVEEFSCGSLN